MKRLILALLIILIIAIVAGGVYFFSLNDSSMPVNSESVEIQSGEQIYPAYLSSPGIGDWPAVVLIHSFNGLEPGYKVMVDRFASEGFVVIAPEWQTFTRTPSDDVVMQLVSDSVAYLKTRGDVDASSVGLTGFCAGGRYTMLFLPQMTDFKSGVAWYGFPYSGGSNNQSIPADFIEQLNVPMLIIHGTRDQASDIEDIYNYSTALDEANKYFEMKVYQGEPHGFMIADGQLSESFPAQDAYWQMVTFFNRTLK